MIYQALALILIVGIVTAGIGVRFDRFFTLLLLIFLFNKGIFEGVDILLWIVLFGTLMILLENKEAIFGMEKKMKIKMFVIVPILTALASLLGSFLFSISPRAVLIVTLGIIAVLYGLRLIFIHFAEDEFTYENEHPHFVKFCGLFGPIISGFSLSFIGTSLKPLKIPLAVKVGKMNMKQVYMGNTVSAFFGSVFALIWHNGIFAKQPTQIKFEYFLLAAGLWTGMHYVAEITNLLIQKSWKKYIQIAVGLVLSLVSIKVFMLAF